jgi:hypothetical protein
MHAHRLRRPAALATTLLLAAAVALIGTGPATGSHDATPWSAYLTVAGGVAGDVGHQEFPSVLADGRGAVYVVHTDRLPSGATNVYVSKIQTRGPFGTPAFLFRSHVNPGLPDAVRRANAFGQPWPPAAAMDAVGNLYVAWTHTGLDVYVSRSADGGATWGAPVLVSNVAMNNFAPDVAVTPGNAVWVTWYQVDPATGRTNLTIARSDDFGATFAGAVNVTGPSPGTAILRWHDLASDAQGRLHVAYMSDLGSQAHVNLTWSDDGRSWSGPARLDGGTWAGYPSLEVDASGRVHVGWVDQRVSPSGSLTMWYRRSDDRGGSWTPELPVSQGAAPVLAFTSDIAVHGDGVMVGWGGNVGGAGMALALSADGGDLWYPESFARPGPGGFTPRIAADENGTFYAAMYHWNELLGNYDVGLMAWDGPPSEPAITSIARGSSSLTISWTASPELDVASYRVWRSQDGSTYTLIATVPAASTSYVDGGLAEGTYWYRVAAVDLRGTSSHGSLPVASTVGATVDERFDAVESDIDDLVGLIGVIRSELATAAMSTLILILLVVILILLIVLLVRTRKPEPAEAMPPRRAVPPPPAESGARKDEGPDLEEL